MSPRALDVLIVEDNPGDVRLIEEMLRDAEGLIRRIGVGEGNQEDFRTHDERTLADGLERIDSTPVDVVLLDLGLPDSTGLDTLDGVLQVTDFVPVVVLTGLRDEEIGLQAIQRGAQDYLVKEEVTSDLLARSIHHALERNRQERTRARQVEQLASLNRLNRISQEVTHAVITTSTRDDLEREVCERFVREAEYPFAWFGEIDHQTDQVTPRVSAGDGAGYLEEATVSVDESETGQGPTGRAIRSQDVQVSNEIQSDPDFEPWREYAREQGYNSSAAVPIRYEHVTYGVLNLYATSPNAFSEPEIDILSRLGDVIGHAITAIERRDALVSDAARELVFTVDGLFEGLLALSERTETTVEFEHVVQADDELVGYGRVEGLSAEAIQETAGEYDERGDVRILDSADDETVFELVTALGTDVVQAVTAHGGMLSSATVTDGEFRMTFRFSAGRDNRKLVELVQNHCPHAEPRAQRSVQRGDDDISEFPSSLHESLTEKQRAALETAYFAGYFDWPRASTSEEIADRLGVTAATFTHHLRAAERKYFEELFTGGPGESDAEPWTSFEPGSVN